MSRVNRSPALPPTLRIHKVASSGLLTYVNQHVPRSGKSYIMAGCIMEDSKNKSTCNNIHISTQYSS